MKVGLVIARNKEGEELTFHTWEEAAKHFHRSMSSLKYQMKVYGECDGYNFERVKIEVSDEGKKWEFKKEPKPKARNEMHYETIKGRICLTHCTFKKEIMVGSVMCKQCNSYQWQDRENQVVYCCHKEI